MKINKLQLRKAVRAELKSVLKEMNISTFFVFGGDAGIPTMKYEDESPSAKTIKEKQNEK
jgi:hypothetical protein